MLHMDHDRLTPSSCAQHTSNIEQSASLSFASLHAALELTHRGAFDERLENVEELTSRALRNEHELVALARGQRNLADATVVLEVLPDRAALASDSIRGTWHARGMVNVRATEHAINPDI